MKYMGSKSRIAKDILNIVLKSNSSNYVELFAGGMNVIQHVGTNYCRTANDSNKYLIAMFTALQNGWKPPKHISREDYLNCKKKGCEDHLYGWIGFNCSYSGKWWGGYAGLVTTKEGKIRDYQSEARRNVLEQVGKLSDVLFTSKDYRDVKIPDGSIVYCDPPYANTTGYFSGFDNDAFWDFIRNLSKNNHVFVSEYTAPNDFKVLWEKQLVSSLSANGKVGGSKTSNEKLYKIKEQHASTKLESQSSNQY